MKANSTWISLKLPRKASFSKSFNVWTFGGTIALIEVVWRVGKSRKAAQRLELTEMENAW